MKKNNIKVRNNNHWLKKDTVLTFKINRTLLWDSAFIKMKILFKNFVPKPLLAT